MDLSFTKDSPKNTTLSLPDGRPVYEIDTPSRNFHTETTTIKKYQPYGGANDIATIEFHSFHKDVCQIQGRDFLPKSRSAWKSYVRSSAHLNVAPSDVYHLTRSLSFTSSNGEVYTWKRKSDTALVGSQSLYTQFRP